MSPIFKCESNEPYKRTYCTLFDFNYAAKGIALINSLIRKADPDFRLHVLALDNKTAHCVRKLMDIRIVVHTLEEVMTPVLQTAKGNRTHQEFCWTLASYFCQWLWHKAGLREITYLDSDLFFFSDPTPIFTEMGGRQIGIIPHRLIPEKKHLEVNGIFNVGWVTFRGTVGSACLQKWSEQCLEWCYNRQEPNRFGDQKYLDAWPKAYG